MPHGFEWDRVPDRLDAWMRRMEDKVDALRTDMSALKTMRSQVEEHHERIYGNGQPGILKDVDRLKQARVNLKWVIATLLIPGLAALAVWLRLALLSK